MEMLTFTFNEGKKRLTGEPKLVGVVSSGNLEVLVEPCDLNGKLQIDVNTTITGYEKIWQAVLSDFQDEFQLSDVRISIHDVGASPAIVSLRLNQAIHEF